MAKCDKIVALPSYRLMISTEEQRLICRALHEYRDRIYINKQVSDSSVVQGIIDVLEQAEQ